MDIKKMYAELRAKIAPMSPEQRKDLYYLSSQVLSFQREAVEVIKNTFGYFDFAMCRAIGDICYEELTPGEKQADYNRALRNLELVASVPPEDAEKVTAVCPLLAIRTAKGLTQAKLAELSGVNVRQIRRIEIGEAKIGNITLDNALALAAALGVDVAELRGNN